VGVLLFLQIRASRQPITYPWSCGFFPVHFCVA